MMVSIPPPNEDMRAGFGVVSRNMRQGIEVLLSTLQPHGPLVATLSILYGTRIAFFEGTKKTFNHTIRRWYGVVQLLYSQHLFQAERRDRTAFGFGVFDGRYTKARYPVSDEAFATASAEISRPSPMGRKGEIF
ncbi:hypothetical protein TNIN_51371 [Trichonephila inaurata madagascariensis]|uniref:Uncharacterized protein n=1 Tax=Trichonephila inaurata madagascariensis TaxID=2747483 RepID=A0A8X6XF68_9ARAC|nr:hypothetical protein TNIN_51371 [Trichonephila inaurata madagascariensis]